MLAIVLPLVNLSKQGVAGLVTGPWSLSNSTSCNTDKKLVVKPGCLIKYRLSVRPEPNIDSKESLTTRFRYGLKSSYELINM